MTDSDWISIIALAEFAALLVLILGGAAFWLSRRRRRDTAAATDLVNKVKKAEQSRRGELEALLAESGVSGDELKQQTQRLMAVERHFYEHFIRTYLGRDSAGVQQMDERLKAVIAPYLELRRPAAPAVATAAEHDEEQDGSLQEAGGDQDAQIARLKSALRNLSEEVSQYRETLNRVFSEYTAMFGVHLDPRQQLTAKEIMDRLNTGELAGGEPEGGETANDESAT